MKKKRLHIIAATTLFAILLWISVKLGETYNATISIPFSLKNLPSGMAPRTVLPAAIHMRIRGDGWNLAGLLLGKERPYAAEVSQVSGNHPFITLSDVVRLLDLPAGVQPLEMEPDSLFLVFDSLAVKKIPVLLDYSASFKDHYGQVGPTTVVPESVTVEGARSLLENIRFWPTALQNFDNLKDPLSVEVPLLSSSIHALTFMPNVVTVNIDVQWFAEKVFAGVPVEVISVPPHREVILVPPKIEVIVRGGVNQLSAISLTDFRSFVDYGILLSDTTGTIGPEVVAPSGVQIVSRRPEQLQYVIRRRL